MFKFRITAENVFIVSRRVNGIFQVELETQPRVSLLKLPIMLPVIIFQVRMTPDRQRRIKEMATKFLVCGVTTILCLGMLEIAVRFLFPYYRPGSQILFTVNTNGVITGAPGQTMRQRTPKGDFDLLIKFNQQGFRDSKDTSAGSSNNIFVAGDSFSLGWGVDEPERYSNVMEKELKKPVYNISIPEDIRGYISTMEYVKKIGAEVQHLVLGLCMENDIWDYSLPVSTHAMYSKDMNPGRMRAVFTWFKINSALWMFASHQIQRTRVGRDLFETFGIAKNVEALTHKNEYSPQILSATRDELLKLTRSYNSVVLIIPSRGLWHGKNMAVEKKIHDELLELLRSAGVRIVDMRPVFEKTGQPLGFYFTSDPHWNAAGHKLAGEELSRYVRTLPDWQNVFAN